MLIPIYRPENWGLMVKKFPGGHVTEKWRGWALSTGLTLRTLCFPLFQVARKEKEEVLSFEFQKIQHTSENGWGPFPMVLPEGRSMTLGRPIKIHGWWEIYIDRRIGPQGPSLFSSILEPFSLHLQHAGLSMLSDLSVFLTWDKCFLYRDEASLPDLMP